MDLRKSWYIQVFSMSISWSCVCILNEPSKRRFFFFVVKDGEIAAIKAQQAPERSAPESPIGKHLLIWSRPSSVLRPDARFGELPREAQPPHPPANLPFASTDRERRLGETGLCEKIQDNYLIINTFPYSMSKCGTALLLHSKREF